MRTIGAVAPYFTLKVYVERSTAIIQSAYSRSWLVNEDWFTPSQRIVMEKPDHQFLKIAILGFVPLLVLTATQQVAMAQGGSQSGPELASSEVMQERVNLIAEGLVESLQETYEEAYLGTSDADLAEITIAESVPQLETSENVMEILEEKTEDIMMEADVDLGLTIDAVSAELVSEPTVSVPISEDTAIVEIEVEITRHIAEDDVDWVEVVPYAVTIDEYSAQIVDLEILDIEHEENLN